MSLEANLDRDNPINWQTISSISENNGKNKVVAMVATIQDAIKYIKEPSEL